MRYSFSLSIILALSTVTFPILPEAAVSAKTSEATANPFRLQKLARPLSQHIQLRLDPALDNYTGTTQIKLSLLQATPHFEISGSDYSIEQAVLIAERGQRIPLKVLRRDEKMAKLSLGPARQPTLAAGRYTLSITFRAPYNTRSVGLYKTLHKGQPYLFTQFEDIEARRAFPVFDEPEYKIPYTWTLEAPEAYQVYANTPVQRTQPLKDGWVRYAFAPTPPIPSYLLALTVGAFDEVPMPGLSIPGRVLVPAPQPAQNTAQGKLTDYVVAETPAILKNLENYFGRPHPYAKLDFVAVPEFPFGAMENPGLITYREDYLLKDPEQVSQRSLEGTVNVIAHELAHQWFGNLVTMAWWDDLWLNEAFATWMANKVTARLHPEFHTELHLPQNRAMSYDARVTTRPIRKPITRANDIIEGLGLAYSKGSAVLAMTEHWIGAEAFQKGLRQYMTDFAFKNAQAADLWNALEKSSGKPVPEVLQSYIEQAAFPLISLDIYGKRVVLAQERFALMGQQPPAQQWSVPVSLRYGRGDRVASTSVLLQHKTQSVTLDFEPEWIYPDAGAMGYYRWLLPTDAYRRLLQEAETQLSPRERLSVMSGAYDLFNNGSVLNRQYMPLLSRFLRDSHPKVVATAYRYLLVQEPLFVNDSNRERWKNFKQQKSSFLLQRYGRTPQPEETEDVAQLRSSLFWQLGTLKKDASLQAEAEQAVARYFAGETTDPLLINSYLSLVAYYGDRDTFQRYREAFENPVSPVHRSRILSALGYFGDPDVQTLAMNYALSEQVSASDLRYIMAGFSFRPERHRRFQDWLETHYDRLKAALPPFRIPAVPGYWLEHRCDIDGARRAKAFFAQREADNEVLQKELSKTLSTVRACQTLSRFGQEDFDAFFDMGF